MKVVGIAGSLRSGSYSHTLLEIALTMAKSPDVEVETIDLRNTTLPFCDASSDYSNFPDVQILQQKCKEADAIILVSPEYHGSMSGVLKNALDLLTFEHVEGKLFALIGVTGGEVSTNAINMMRIVCRHLHAWVLPYHLSVPYSNQAFDENRHLKDEKLSKRLKDLIEHLIVYTQKFRK